MNAVAIGSSIVVLCTLTSPARAVDYCDTQVPAVIPGSRSADTLSPPSDAIVLFDGKDLSEWLGKTGKAQWIAENGLLVVKHGEGDIWTKQAFADVQLHIEWRIPATITGTGQRRGNSGVIFLDRYELQILDSYENRTYATGQAGAIYGQTAPLVNAMRPPGEWNSFDVIFTAPRFYADGRVLAPARLTVLHNGILVQNNAEIFGTTGKLGNPGYYEVLTSGPIRLQDHQDEMESISFRNIWVRELNKPLATEPSRGSTEPLPILSTRTVQELLDNPATREVLMRCVPELSPNPKIVDYVAKHTLPSLTGDVDVSLTEAKLRIIESELARALAGASHGNGR